MSLLGTGLLTLKGTAAISLGVISCGNRSAGALFFREECL